MLPVSTMYILSFVERKSIPIVCVNNVSVNCFIRAIIIRQTVKLFNIIYDLFHKFIIMVNAFIFIFILTTKHM